MRILLLSRYSDLGASSRLRFLQYLPYLRSKGFEIVVEPLLDNNYLSRFYEGKRKSISGICCSYFHRVSLLLKASHFDLVCIDKELFPYFPAIGEAFLSCMGIPYIVDYDDAVFHRYDQHEFGFVRSMLGKKIDSVIRMAELVIVGNHYLGERARSAGAKRIEVLPTVVDTARYSVRTKEMEFPVVIGWIGTPSTIQYLNLVAHALQNIIASRCARLVVVGANPLQMQGLPVEVRPWSENSEVEDIQQFDIGIMPLRDGPWERGKCGYKLIQYMACGKPVVASPVGVNSTIVQNGINGFLADNEHEWIQAFELLCDDPCLREEMGLLGRERVEKEFSLNITAPKLEEILCSVERK
jgi:glycosyltransferase involved in cell wall biosynthesis